MGRKRIEKILDNDNFPRGSDSHETRLEMLLAQIVIELKKINRREKKVS